MKKYLLHIKFLLLFAVVVFLFGFASFRNEVKKPQKIDVNFNNGENLFISYEMVNKLLIQNLSTNKIQSKENINLDNLENFLQSNQMIENAEVYLTVSGELGAIITQRIPVIRVANNLGSYYLDRFGKEMPLSENYSARVPITTSTINKNNVDKLICLANHIKNDDFLKKQIIGVKSIEIDSTVQFELKTRLGDHTVAFGDLKRMKEKTSKLKVFYQKAISDSTLNAYKRINLKFENQVVCTKK